ncbi:MAG: hypothetical protein EOP36_19175 [Rubrivivax sp.]|nr:MAG: hypothetical protein EOP36_19175 [Rubrivivax sp.]
MLNKLASSALACMVLSSTALAQSDPIISPTPFSSHYIATRLDLRKCAFPACGGYYVKAVNRALTRCADGTLRKECHVAVLNTKALPWSDADRAAFEQSFIPGQGLVRGQLVAVKGSTALRTDTLVISEGWVGQADSKPLGVFYQLKNSGIVCITTPCPSINETTLNYPISRNIHGLDLAASGAKPAQVEAGLNALGSTGVLAAGGHKTITGPAGQGQQFIASQFYLPFTPAKTR